jgi:hypothetical protein
MEARVKPAAHGWLVTVAEAVALLARHRYRATLLIVDGEEPSAAGGIAVGAVVSVPIILSLCAPDPLNALSRGALLLRDGVIVRAGVPLVRASAPEWPEAVARELSAFVVDLGEDGTVRFAAPPLRSELSEAAHLVFE